MSLMYDPTEAVAALKKADKRLARIIRKAGEFTMRPERMQSLFHALLRAIVFQQLSGKAASTILNRVYALYEEGSRVAPERVLATADKTLRSAGLSRNKLLAIKDLAAKTNDGTVPPLAKLRKLTDQEIIDCLTAIRGIGPWTVEMLLIFRLGRADVLPVSDLGVRKGFQIVYELDDLPDAKAMHLQAELWRPYRSVASWYLWRATEQ